MRIAPVVPSYGQDMLAELTIHKQRVGVGTPRTTEIYLADSLCCDNLAAVEHIAILLALEGGGCGDVAVALGAYLAVLEPAAARAEDEVRGALNQTVHIQAAASLPVISIASVSVDGVLVADDVAAAQHDAVAVGVPKITFICSSSATSRNSSKNSYVSMNLRNGILDIPERLPANITLLSLIS